jgi:uncharacterized protein (DUF1015 family)
MALLRSFRALRPEISRVGRVAAVPYDVVNLAEARALAKSNPWSLLHVSRAEIDLPDDTDPYSNTVYEQAELNFKRLIEQCPLVLEDSPHLYLYRVIMAEHVQTGIVGCFSIDEYDSDRIKKHEKTRKAKEDDRTRHIRQLAAQTGPVFLTYPGVPEIDQEVDVLQALPPLYDFTADDHVRHTVWKIQDCSKIQKLFLNKVPTLYIADGHHRAAAASRVRSERVESKTTSLHGDEYQSFLAVAFPVSQLKIMPYHRVIKDLAGFSEAQLIDQVARWFEFTSGDPTLPDAGEFGMYLGGRWYRLKPKTGQKGRLDVETLQELILAPLLRIQDPRSDERIDFVGGIRGTSELEKRVNQRQAAVAFALHPTKIQDVMDIADRGGIMPPKSTWFEPKLRDGLLIHTLR